MLSFLRLFPQFCALEAQLQDAASRMIDADDRVREYRAKCESAESERDKARIENSFLMKAVADWQAISAGHLPIFNVVPVPPRSEEDEGPYTLPRKSARDVQTERNAAARKLAHEQMMQAQSEQVQN